MSGENIFKLHRNHLTYRQLSETSFETYGQVCIPC